MSTIARAWDAFLAAVAEARMLHASGGSPAAIQDVLQHAREPTAGASFSFTALTNHLLFAYNTSGGFFRWRAFLYTF